MPTVGNGSSSNSNHIAYVSIRNTTPPGVDGVVVYRGNIAVSELLKLSTKDNVRDFLPDTPNKGKRQYSQVHRAIESTLLSAPENFALLNSGVVIGARDVEVDDKGKIVKLIKASILNGAQTRGVIMYFLEQYEDPGTAFVSFEIIVTKDEDLLAEISIARNFQNQVDLMSIMNKRDVFKDLEKVMEDHQVSFRCRQSDDWGDYDIAHLLKLCFLCTPMWISETPIPNRTYCYNSRVKPMRDLEKMLGLVGKLGQDKVTKHYQFMLDAAPVIWNEYIKWMTHPGLNGRKYQWIGREEDGTRWIPDGVIFPILAALSSFLVKTKNGWEFQYPEKLGKKMIEKAATVCSNIYAGQPGTMGKSAHAYAVMEALSEAFIPEANAELIEEAMA